MSKFKIQMADDGAGATSMKLTDNEHGHATRTLSEGTTVFTNEKHIPMKDQLVTKNPWGKTRKLR